MSDIVERLRHRAHNGIAPMHELARLDILAAADEIERLHQLLKAPTRGLVAHQPRNKDANQVPQEACRD